MTESIVLQNGKYTIVLDKNDNIPTEAIKEMMDILSRDMSPAEYREFLDEIGAEVESREACLDEEAAV